jgi:hypothetical protein
VLDGFDQGGHDILVNYSRFYSLAITYPEVPFVEEFTELVDLAKISYPEQDRYSVDVILDGELIENESGESSIEGFEPEISAGSEIAIRVRYKDPDNPYFGKIPLILTYRTGVQLALPVEVVKSV